MRIIMQHNIGWYEAVAIDCDCKPIAGLVVQQSCLRVEGSDGVGVVSPGAPGRITRRAYVRLPRVGDVLLWDFVSGVRDTRYVVEVTCEDFRSIMDREAFERQVSRIQQDAEYKIRMLQHAIDDCMKAETGKLVYTIDA